MHQRLSTPVGQPGAMTLFHATQQEHLSLAKHLTAEAKTEEFIAGKGVMVKWERIRRQNHWFDALYNACAAGHAHGIRLVEEQGHEQSASGHPTIQGRVPDWVTPSMSWEEHCLSWKRW